MTRGAPAPLHLALARAPDGGRAFWLQTTDGLRLRAALWQRAGARGTVVLFTGRTEYIEKYGPTIADLAQRGYDLLTLDWRGQGLSDRLLDDPLKGHVAAFADYQHDVAALWAALPGLNLRAPLHLLAHSMGGAIGLRALHQGLAVRSAVFSAPMWGIRLPPGLTGATGLLAHSLAQAGFALASAPGTGAAPYVYTTAFSANALTHDPAAWAQLVAHLAAVPALAVGGPTLGWLDTALAECRALAALPSPTLPCLTGLGADETIVCPTAITARMARWPGGHLARIEGARHELMMERTAPRARFLDAATALFDAQG
ncbi:hypothetical protein CCR83_11255 [Rhodobacter veldkampii DSM 11550]|uniref:Alpha/beta hydrolase n=1 Tax=Phaeovulum veldkampii DSM 11550 TaxID=1185920 RepID=A0A2T4JAK5_9RHOB|nr:alpha/beta hydrolase [Phaeovulum veldkampii]MBK5947001.1 hypothetical protein [Phaeovulum veldkampii DSM 11550]PTE14919.1 alpha/beta hydrolase [Phaeovulum veldkampii DSM 11550]TDQ55591.1 lysophospholipase [Phaeovulum veldkampii DSM 11550]